MTDPDGSTFRPSSGLTPPVPSDLSLHLQINLSAQILQTNGRLYHLAPASPCCLKTVNSRVPLLPRNYSGSTLIRTHPPPSRLSAHFPLFTVIEPTLLRKISSRGEEGFSSCSACPCHRAVATTPPEWMAVSISFRRSMLPSPYGCGLGLWGFALSGPPMRSLSLRPGDSLTSLKDCFVNGLQILGFPPICHSSYRIPDSYPGRAKLLPNMPAFAGHTTGQADFPDIRLLG